jgi:hypothetical protein
MADVLRDSYAAVPRLLTWVLIVYLAWGALLFKMQRAMMFPGAGAVAPPRAPLPAMAERILLELPFGAVEAIHWRSDAGPQRPALLIAHGNFEFLDQQLDGAAGFVAAGIDVLMLEYPGYGRSAGSASRASIDHALRAAYDHLAERPDIDTNRIAALGRSLGSGPVMALALERRIAAVILQSGYAAVADFARERWLPGFLVRDDWDNVAALARWRGPLLIAHGRHDDVIPYAHAERLGRAAPHATLLTLECAHNDCPYFNQDFARRLSGWLREHLAVR